MIYICGDCHGEFKRFSKGQRNKLPFLLMEEDYVIVCGDFGLLWCNDKEFTYNLKWLSNLPFTLLWVQGNHENYNMISEYPIEVWNGGKVRHIVRDKIILLERGQVFTIENKTFFTFGGASSHDIQGGVLDRTDPAYDILRRKAIIKGLPYRVLNESWWSQELPTEEELQEGRNNLEKVGYKVDYVISHCCSTSIQNEICSSRGMFYESDILTDYFEELEQKLQYKKHYFGHYHIHKEIDEKHTVVYKKIIPVEKINMYKVVLYDVNTTAFVTSYIHYYTNDIEDFQKRWFALEENEERKTCFLKSKAGEYASDIYNITNEEYQKLKDAEKYDIMNMNMVQYDENFLCMFEKIIPFENLEVIVTNGFGCETKYYMKNIDIIYKYICFQDNFVKMAKFKAKGVCSDSVVRSEGYVCPVLFGNRVLEISDTSNLPYKTQDKSVYDEVTVKIIAYKELQVFDDFEDMLDDWQCNLVNERELDLLFQDFVGDAG